MNKLFSDREIRAVVIFVPLAALVLMGIFLIRPKADPQAARIVEAQMEQRTDSMKLMPFDPNEVEYAELRQMGLSKAEATSLLRFRAAGKVFRIPEDVALCYEISDSLYAQLSPYIRIGRRYAITPRNYRSERIVVEPLSVSPFRIDTVTTHYMRAIGALSKRQAEVFISWRNMHGIYDMDELRECYVISDSIATALESYIIFPERKANPWKVPVELNKADSATLRSIVGIGGKTVETIMHYRDRLGGFVRTEQLAEVPGVTESNYEKIVQQIYCDSNKIQKIDVNSATPNALAHHPYITPPTLRKLLKTRQLKGGWNRVEEMINDGILKQDAAARLAPYLDFGPRNMPPHE